MPGRSAGVDFATIHAAVSESPASPVLLFAGLALLAIGLLFKAAAAPFHVWTPDVYQGAPTPITALMAACTKVAAFGALLRVFYVAFADANWDFTPVLGAVAVLTMLVGAVLAVTQTDIKRLLAYSSIANAGYLLVGVLAPSRDGLCRHDVLPGRVRLLGARRVRRGDPGPRRGRRGHPPVPLGRAGPAVAAVRRRCSRSSCWPSPVSR